MFIIKVAKINWSTFQPWNTPEASYLGQKLIRPLFVVSAEEAGEKQLLV